MTWTVFLKRNNENITFSDIHRIKEDFHFLFNQNDLLEFVESLDTCSSDKIRSPCNYINHYLGFGNTKTVSSENSHHLSIYSFIKEREKLHSISFLVVCRQKNFS